MREWKKTLISPATSIKKAIEVIDSEAMQIAMVVDKSMRLMGTVTDGDIRRGILKGISLEQEVQHVMNSNPITVSSNESRPMILAKMKQKFIRQIPVVNAAGRVVDLEVLDNLLSAKSNVAILMAGGLGTRLLPLTSDRPKPLVDVGGKPILEMILENLIEYGFHNFFISVNYKSEMIQKYFKDGKRWNVEIKYLHETKKLGTAGALGMLPEKPKTSIVVMNSDLVTNVNFHHLLDFHHKQKSYITACVKEYDFQVPYGVVKIGDSQILGIDEKPVQRFFVNAGIHVLDPGVIQYVQKNSCIDMPQLIEKVKSRHKVLAFPIREYWLDVGRLDDLKQARKEISSLSSTGGRVQASQAIT